MNQRAETKPFSAFLLALLRRPIIKDVFGDGDRQQKVRYIADAVTIVNELFIISNKKLFK